MTMEGPKGLYFAGYDYTFKQASQTTRQYRCKHYRSDKCSASIIVANTTQEVSRLGVHMCSREKIGALQTDMHEEMRKKAIEKAVDNAETSPKSTWASINNDIEQMVASSSMCVIKEKEHVI
jgi:hypothetical protein